VLIESLAQHRLNERLSTYVELPRRRIELGEHWRRKVNIYSLDRRHHAALVAKKARYVLAVVRPARNVFGGNRRRVLTIVLRRDLTTHVGS
jgi:hypothetical protein